MAHSVTVIVVALLQITVGKDLTWFPNSNWDNHANWNLGRLTYASEVADFSQAPDSSVIYLDTSVTVRSIVLPVNGKIVLGAKAAIRFSSPTTASGGADKKQVNYFVGARQNWWECAENWRTSEGLPADTAPCSKDKAIFPAGASFSFVNSNTTVSVQELIIRGASLTSITGGEFSLNLTVKPDCAKQPALCSCSVFKCSLDNSPLADRGAPNMAAATVGSVVGVLLLLLLVVPLVVVAAIWFCRHIRRTGSYKRESLDEETAESPNDKSTTGAFCNPMYSEQAGMREDKLEDKLEDKVSLTRVEVRAEVIFHEPFASTSEPMEVAEPLYDDPDQSCRNPAMAPV